MSAKRPSWLLTLVATAVAVAAMPLAARAGGPELRLVPINPDGTDRAGSCYNIDDLAGDGVVLVAIEAFGFGPVDTYRGGQFFLAYDRFGDCWIVDSVEPGGPGNPGPNPTDDQSPFQFEVFSDFSTPGQIDYAVSVSPVGDPVVIPDGTILATIQMNPIINIGDELCCHVELGFRTAADPTEMAQGNGTKVPPLLSQLFPASPLVLVIDARAPDLVCPVDITQDNDPGLCSAVVNVVPPTVVDNCDGLNLSADGVRSDSKPLGDPFNVGTTTITWSVADACGNQSECTQTVTVRDVEAPEINACPASVLLDANEGCEAAVPDFTGGVDAVDGCDGIDVSITQVPAAGTMVGLGTTTVQITVTDSAGNANTSCTVDVDVQDATAPTVTECPLAVTLAADANCGATIPDLTGDVAAVDNCDGPNLIITQDPAVGTTIGLGTQPVQITVTDSAGNSDTSCVVDVTVADQTPPTITECPPDQTVQPEGNNGCDATVDPGFPTATDNCSTGAGITIVGTRDDQLPLNAPYVGGDTVITWTATDEAGNSSTCTTTITVVDQVPPTALCKDITVQLDASGNASITAADIDAGSSDACGIGSLAIDRSSFTCADVGPNTVVLTVTDVNGNTATCSATVTVEDNVAPDALCQDVTVQLDAGGNASITAADVDAGSSDACGIASIGVAPSSFTCANVGPNAVTLTVTDVNGNTSTCSATVTVEDNVAPDALCQDITVQLDASGNASITAADIDAGSSDTCGIDSITVEPSSFTCADVGPNSVTLTVTDVNGNSSTCTATVTVEDNVAPDALCQDVTVQLDAGGNASITAADVDAGSSDACGIDSMTVEPSSFTCADVGPNAVTLTVTDVNGNTSTCSATVTVEDNVAPDALCQDITVQLDAGGNASITAADIDAGSSDACGIDLMTVEPGTFTCADLGPNAVTLTVTDVNGNVSTCPATVTVADDTAPALSCPQGPIVVDADAGGTTAVVDFDVSADDNCAASVPVTCDFPSGSTFPQGTTSVTCTATDGSGNTGTCQFDVEVLPVSGMQVTVELSPAVTTQSFDRCITFQLFDECGYPSDPVHEVLTFTGDPSTGVGQASATVLVPAGAWTCVTARDQRYTLQRTDETITIAGTQFEAEFVGDPAQGGDWLIQGNLDGDDRIGIADLALLLLDSAHFPRIVPASLPCPADLANEAAADRGDFNGDGTVFVGDLTFVLVNFLKKSEAGCPISPDCQSPKQVAAAGGKAKAKDPLTSISVEELARRGHPDAASIDSDGDGDIDLIDIRALMRSALAK